VGRAQVDADQEPRRSPQDAHLGARCAGTKDRASPEAGAPVTLYRLCSVCGVQIPQYPHTRGPCQECRRERERKRGKTKARGYDAEHKRLSKLAIAQHPFCVDCGATEDLVGDHIVPYSRGGLNVLSNYAVRCRSCNTARGNRESVFLTGQRRDPTPALREKHSAGVPSPSKDFPGIG
jgi:5-methylcytosine-specific restriction endonuclease McrA